MNFIDNFLNKVTMYRLVLYYLIFLLLAAVVLSSFDLLSFSPFSLILSMGFILTVCWITNAIFAKTFKAPTNLESVYISALILSLIITPIATLHDLPFLFWVSVLAMASKYILALNKKHIFNPVAFAVTLTSFTGLGIASWWVGMLPMLLPVFFGLLIVRKIRRFDLFFYFFITPVLTILIFTFLNKNNPFTTLQTALFYSPILFFAFTMLTEPLTTPPTKKLQSIYGVLVGFLFAPQMHIGSIFITPEIGLVLGNIFSYLVSPKDKLILALQEKIKIAPDIYDFTFTPSQKFTYTPGQYLEWTLSHPSPDSRGNRRYFTLASSPTEKNLRIGIKFGDKLSSFKKSILLINQDTPVVASQLAGDFVLPKDPDKKLVFIAGGIGITPFRSMVKYLLDTSQKRVVTIFYSNKLSSDIVYSDIFTQAFNQLGIKTIYTLTDLGRIPSDWNGKKGYVNGQMIKEEIPDYKERLFYISGPHLLVTAMENILKNSGITNDHIKVDYFPGYT